LCRGTLALVSLWSLIGMFRLATILSMTVSVVVRAMLPIASRVIGSARGITPSKREVDLLSALQLFVVIQ
jgi:hypothetical protein